MARGIVGATYDCKTLRLLPRCTAAGGYAYVALTRKEERLTLKGSQELEANLPSARLGAELRQAASLEAHLVVVGQRSASRSHLEPAHLAGECAGATHFVRGATIGAFTLSTAASADAKAELGIDAVGAKGAGSSERRLATADGTLESCTAGADDAAPPAGCSALLQLELAPLGDPLAEDQDLAPPSADELATGASGLPARPSFYCPSGTTWQAGRCASAAAGPLCGADDVDACEAQCRSGNGESCATLGFFHYVGRVVDKDFAQAASLWDRGCELGNDIACQNLGVAYAFGHGVARDLREAINLLRETCGRTPGACRQLGVLLSRPEHVGHPDHHAARSYFQRACDAGDFDGCGDLAYAYWEGQGAPRDESRAAELDDHACRGGAAVSCRRLGARYHDGGATIARDRQQARAYFHRACQLGDAQGCGFLGLYYIDGLGGLVRDASRGVGLAMSSCHVDSVGCIILVAHYEHTGDLDTARKYRALACERGDQDSCR